MNDVSNRLKDKIECPCTRENCTVYGTPRAPKNGHVDGCICTPCRNGINRKAGVGAQIKSAKRRKVANYRTGNEQSQQSVLNAEHKHGAQCQPVFTTVNKSLAQIEATRRLGDNRPPLATFSMDEEPYELWVIRSDKAQEAAWALCEDFGLV